MRVILEIFSRVAFSSSVGTKSRFDEMTFASRTLVGTSEEIIDGYDILFQKYLLT